METEIWKDIPGFEGYYQASDQGNIQSLDRIVMGAKNRPRKVKGKVLSQGTTGDYAMVVLKKDGAAFPCTVHRLVLLTFVGPPPTPEHQCNHLNLVKSDNRRVNLEWATRAENVQHAWDNGAYSGKLRNPAAKSRPRKKKGRACKEPDLPYSWLEVWRKSPAMYGGQQFEG